MDAWGINNFENAVGLDFCQEVLAEEDLVLLREPLETAAAGEPDEKDAAWALSAAEVLVAIMGAPSEDASEELVEWAELENDEDVSELVPLALEVVATIKSDSGLRDYWEENDRLDDWTGVLDDLESRLSDYA